MFSIIVLFSLGREVFYFRVVDSTVVPLPPMHCDLLDHRGFLSGSSIDLDHVTLLIDLLEDSLVHILEHPIRDM